jgi:hypothetical protein
MTIPIRQSTASQEIPLGYFLDSINGDDEETGLNITNTDIKLWKHGATTVVSKNSGGATHIGNGIYYCVLDDIDSDTLGGLVIFIHFTGALAVRVECRVYPANEFDSLILGTDVLEVDMTQCGGSAVAAGAIPNAAADAAGGIPISDLGGLDLDTKLANTNEITAARMGALTDWINGERLDLILDLILADTAELQGNQSAWATATGFSTHSAANVKTAIEAAGSSIALILADTSELQTNQGTWATAVGFSTHSAADVKTAIEAAGSNLALILADTGTDGVLLAATATSAQLVDDMWDEILTGATHNIATSAGRRIREIGAYAIHAGTAQAGNSHTITLAASASANDGVYNRNLIILTDNIGVGQTRTIVDYDGATKIAVIDRDWRTSPDATTAYQITPDNTPLVVDQGVAQEGTSTTIKLRAYASSANDIYLCNVVAIIAGTGRGQARLVGSYDGTSKVATICGDNWVTNPDNTSVYVLMPYGTTCTSCIGTYARGQIKTECETALTDYDPPTRAEATTDKEEIITEVDANETKIDLLQIDSTAIKSKTDNLPSGIGKNEALAKFDVFMVLSSDHVTGATGKTVAGAISKDGGAFAAITNAITEVSHGMYTIASGFTQTEMNADTVTLKFTADDCDVRIITIHTS